MRVAVDIDGTVTLNPGDFQNLMQALRAAGHMVVVATGCSRKHPKRQDVEEKVEYLTNLGLGDCWDEIVVFGDPPHKAKAKYCKDHHVDILIDNSIKNAQLASRYCVVLVPWNEKAD